MLADEFGHQAHTAVWAWRMQNMEMSFFCAKKRSFYFYLTIERIWANFLTEEVQVSDRSWIGEGSPKGPGESVHL